MMMIKQTIWLTILIEGLTILMRYGFHLQSTRDTASTIGRLTLGLRIHHGYIGLILIVAYYAFFVKKSGYIKWLLPIGLALVLSDLIHHFLVLWPIEGDPQFHFWYPHS